MPARQPIDPAWWNADHIDGVAMREALAERDIKTVFNFLHHRGWSWGAIAQATDIGEQRVREIASGKRRVENYDVYVRVAVGLDIPRDYLGVGLRVADQLGTVASPSAPPKLTPPLPYPLEVGRPDLRAMVSASAEKSARFAVWADSLGIGDLAFETLWLRLGQLAVDYVHAPMAPIFQDLEAMREHVFELLASPDPAQAPNLYLLAGTVCGLLAHASGNLGYVGAAQVQACTALVCARKAGNSTLGAWVLGVRALQAEWSCNPSISLKLIAQAAKVGTGEQVPSTVPVWLAAIEARAHGRSGNRAKALDALNSADRHRDRIADEPDHRNGFDDIGGILTFTQAKQYYYAGTTYRRIGDFEAAASNAQRAISAYAAGPAHQRSYGDEAIAWADLAIARASGQNVDLDGAAQALRVIEALPDDRRLPTLIGPLRDLDATLTSPRIHQAQSAIAMRDSIGEMISSCHRSLPKADK